MPFIRVHKEALQRALRLSPEKLFRRLNIAAGDIGQRYIGYHRAHRLGGMEGAKGVRGTRGQPGLPGLLRAYYADVSGTTLESIKIQFHTPSYVAREHEFGATIHAKAGTYMTVPMPDAYGADHRVLQSVRRLMADAKLARRGAEFGFNILARGAKRQRTRIIKDKLFIIRRRDGKLFLAMLRDPEARDTRSRLKILFHLEPVVKLQPRTDFLALWDQFIPTAVKRFNQAIQFALVDIRGGAP
jgi:hypothetical protein